jgi:uncharacterized protein with von Willebrand factor type A (vWA) domain
MDARIVEFAEVLRQNGLKVSASETLDAVQALAEVGLRTRALTRTALRATLCKHAADVPVFERAFDYYFSGAARTLEGLDRTLARRLVDEGLLEGDELRMVVAWLDSLGGQLSPLTQASLQGDRGRLAGIFRQAALQLDFSRLESSLQAGFYGRRLASGAGVEAMRSDLGSIASELEARGVSPRGLEIVGRQLSAALRQVEDAARAEVQRQLQARLRTAAGGASDKPFSTLTRQEVAQAQKAVQALAERLKARLVRRGRSRRRGQLNPRLTLRKNITTGGVPMVPHFRSRKAQRPDVVVLCDVSDSVRITSRLMLLFTWTLQALFSRVRTFIFVSELGEVTRFFRGAKVDQALDAATGSGVISLAANSNYGHALAQFARSHLGSVTRKTTVFVIGDGRNNFNQANVWALQDITRKARRVVWIATEPSTSWGFGDSELAAYSRAVSQVVVVRSLSELARLAERLVPRY